MHIVGIVLATAPSLAISQICFQRFCWLLGGDINGSAHLIRPLKQRRIPFGNFNCPQIVGQNPRQIEVAVIGNINGHTVEIDRHLTTIKATNFDLFFVAAT